MLLDDALSLPWEPHTPEHLRVPKAVWEKQREHLIRQLRAAPVFEISNVAQYLYLGTDQERWDLRTDFPRPVPPFEMMWCEWKLPQVTHSEGTVQPLLMAQLFSAVGCIIVRVEIDSREIPETELCGARWWLTIVPLAKPLGHPKVLFAGCRVTVGLSTDGDVVNFAKGVSIFSPAAGDARLATLEDTEAFTDEGQATQGTLFVAYLALSLLNCRNVTTKEVRMPAPLVKKHRSLGRHVTPVHNIIEIQPIITVVQNQTGRAGHSSRAAAIIRGHFKDYSHGSGLFGKYKGMFWWDQQVHGIAAHEYRLKDAIGPLDPKWKRKP